jgi:hypothetical protein
VKMDVGYWVSLLSIRRSLSQIDRREYALSGLREGEGRGNRHR